MKSDDFRINQEQAIIFARRIYSDISAYIQSHQEEYQEFLEKQEEDKAYED